MCSGWVGPSCSTHNAWPVDPDPRGVGRLRRDSKPASSRLQAPAGQRAEAVGGLAIDQQGTGHSPAWPGVHSADITEPAAEAPGEIGEFCGLLPACSPDSGLMSALWLPTPHQTSSLRPSSAPEYQPAKVPARADVSSKEQRGTHTSAPATRTTTRGASSTTAAGSLTLKVVPWSLGRDGKKSQCAAWGRWTMARAIDMPPSPWAGAPHVSPRAKRSRNRSRHGGDRGRRVDAHDERVPSRAPASWSRVPAGVCARALARRLTTTWRRRASSPMTSGEPGEVLGLLRRGVGQRLQDGQIQLPVVVGAGRAGVSPPCPPRPTRSTSLSAQLARRQAGPAAAAGPRRVHRRTDSECTRSGRRWPPPGLVGVGLSADELGVAADRR